MTHFESDYGAAPKVEMRKGQAVTMIAPDFKAERWVGLRGTIEDNPFMDICRSQIDVRFACDSDLLAERMPGFHWMLAYGDYIEFSMNGRILLTLVDETYEAGYVGFYTECALLRIDDIAMDIMNGPRDEVCRPLQ